MTYKEKVIKDYGIDPTHLVCPADIFNNAYSCSDDNNFNLQCEDCWEREYNNEAYSSMIFVVKNYSKEG